MIKNTCKNNIAFSYEKLANTEFATIEIWPNFGSMHDKLGQQGIAHLIEHLLISQNIVNKDLFSYYNSYATTSRDRIRLYAETHFSQLESILETMLADLFDFNVPEFIFRYHQQKVLFEIRNARYGALVSGFHSIEKMSLSNTGYDYFPVGIDEDVATLSIEGIKSHLFDSLKQHGMLISISGAIRNENKLIDIIEKSTPILGKLKEAVDYSNCIFGKEAQICDNFPEGQIIILNANCNGFEKIDTFICSCILESYLKYNLMSLPIEILEFRYKSYHTIGLYMHNKSKTALKMACEVEKLLSSKPDYKVYQFVLSKVYQSFLHKLFYNNELALYNAEQLFFATEFDLRMITSHLKNYEIEKFTIYLESILDKSRFLKVVHKNINTE